MKQTGTALSALERLAEAALHDNPGWLDEVVGTREAARILNESESTLCCKRTRGGGPHYIKSGARVGYTRRDIFRYIAERRRRSTSDESAEAHRASRLAEAEGAEDARVDE